MRVCIRAHDMGVKGTENILRQLKLMDLDGVQLVCYKAFDDIPYDRGGISREKAKRIGEAFAAAGAGIPMLGAYFNPVHSDREKAARCFDIFVEYLRCCKAMGCTVVGSETGSFNDDKWTYHPRNRTEEALETVVDTFSRLCDIAAEEGTVVAMEGAAGHVCFDVDTLNRALRKMNKANTRVIFDIYNYLDETNQYEYLDILRHGLEVFGDKILLFHMKDWQFVPGSRPKQVPYGTGQMDQRAVLSAIKAHDPDAVLVLEGTTGEHIASAVQSIKEIWESV